MMLSLLRFLSSLGTSSAIPENEITSPTARNDMWFTEYLQNLFKKVKSNGVIR